MDSLCLDEFDFGLPLDETIRDEMNQYMQSSQHFKESEQQMLHQMMSRNNEIVVDNCATPQMSTFVNISNATNESQTTIQRDNYLIDIEKVRFKISLKIDNICQQIIRDMNILGVCVIENLMEEMAELILQEVINLYETVVFSDGKVVHSNMNDKSPIRGDSIHWVTGKEPNCQFINFLISTLDRIIFKSNKMNNNGLMGINTISSRTSAMVACYPFGSRYVKHADNTIADGRYITCIYYVNKNWDNSRDGGILRIYPNQVTNQEPLDISPEFDRLIFFWSDRRNLHEVLPTKRLRFAITVWYFDDEERKRFKCFRNNFAVQ